MESRFKEYTGKSCPVRQKGNYVSQKLAKSAGWKKLTRVCKARRKWLHLWIPETT